MSVSGRRSAGILVYRFRPDLELLIAHPGGPLWAKKDQGAWSIPKGEYEAAEDPFAAAGREFAEETGAPTPTGDYLDLGSVRTSGGKQISAWAVEGDLEAEAIVSNTFELEWPPRSGRRQQFPEIDRAAWFGVDQTREKLSAAQFPFVERLLAAVTDRYSEPASPKA